MNEDMFGFCISNIICPDKPHTIFHDEKEECSTVAAFLFENIYKPDNN